MVREPRANKISMTAEELDALLQQKIAESSVWRYRMLPFLRVLWQSRLMWFLVGMLVAVSITCPFAPGEAGCLWFGKNQSSIIVSPIQIAQAAPNKTTGDQTKRRIIVQVYAKTADQIRQGIITTLPNAMTELRMGTINLQAGEWQTVSDALDAYLSTSSDLDDLVEKIEQIADAFKELS